MSMYRTRSWLLVAGIVVAALIGAWLLKPLFKPASAPSLQSGQLYPEAKPLAPFQLQDQNGAPFSNAQLQGKWSFVFFGYTTCPDICPTTLTVMTKFLDGLANNWYADTQVIFVTLDPERDTVAQLSLYMPFFHKSFIGITGEPDRIDRFARDFAVAYSKRPQDSGGYLVDHSVRLFLLDPKGRRVALFSPSIGAGFSAEVLQTDYQVLRDYAQ